MLNWAIDQFSIKEYERFIGGYVQICRSGVGNRNHPNHSRKSWTRRSIGRRCTDDACNRTRIRSLQYVERSLSDIEAWWDIRDGNPRDDTLMFKLLGKRERNLSCNGHIYFFTTSRLEKFATKAGFTVLKTDYGGRSLTLDRLFYNLDVVSKSQVIKQMLKDVAVKLLLNKISLYLNTRDMERIYLKKTRFWLSITKLKGTEQMRLHQMFECACSLILITHCINPFARDSTKTNFSEGGCGRDRWDFQAIQRIKPDAEFCGCAVFWWTAALAWRSEKSARCVGGFDRTSPRDVLGFPSVSLTASLCRSHLPRSNATI